MGGGPFGTGSPGFGMGQAGGHGRGGSLAFGGCLTYMSCDLGLGGSRSIGIGGAFPPAGIGGALPGPTGIEALPSGGGWGGFGLGIPSGIGSGLSGIGCGGNGGSVRRYVMS